jgi:hypothetical protein
MSPFKFTHTRYTLLTQRRPGTRHSEKSVVTILCLSYLISGFVVHSMLSITKACNAFSFSPYIADLYLTTGSMGYLQLRPLVWRSARKKTDTVIL